jgi:hypothetical protein
MMQGVVNVLSGFNDEPLKIYKKKSIVNLRKRKELNVFL